MKRLRGVEESTPPLSSQLKQQHSSSSTTAATGIIGVAGGGSGAIINVSGNSSNIDYHPGTGLVSAQPVVTKAMPGSIQFGNAQQYPGAIVVPTQVTSSINKGSIGNLSSTGSNVSCASNNSISTSCHIVGVGNSGSQNMAPQPTVVSTPAQPHPQQTTTIRHKVVQAPTPPVAALSGTGSTSSSSQQFQRLKVEDALSYLDQVKYKFNDQPQVYNDFLDIMKEFKSQSIDTPGVITRVSHLFKGHPELIVGFNTFLPPGYKIEVQANEQGYAFQVSVSMPSPTSTHTHTLSQHHCTVNVGSPPIASPPSQPPKTQPIVQIMQGSGNIHHSLSNNITNNNMPIHGSSPALPVQSFNNSHVSAAQVQAVSQAISQAQDGIPNSGQTQQNQPVEFNHAINYVNKIKNRFQGQPDKYKRFLEILHTYQKEQRGLKESSHLGNVGLSVSASGKQLTEAEVYSQVAKLFENQEDLLQEFGQFLPDATNQQSALSAMFQSNKVGAINDHAAIVKKPLGLKTSYNNAVQIPRDHRDAIGAVIDRENRDQRDRDRERSGIREINASQKFGHTVGQLKRSPSFPTALATSNSHLSHGPPPPKKHKITSARDVSIAEVGKHGTLNDYAFFDKVRKALRSQDVYENFLRCLVLFNQEIISKTELLLLVTPFLGRFPELLRWFKDFLGHLPESTANANNQSNNISIEALPNNVVRGHQERPQGDLAMEIDYSTCKRLGASYCALPKSYIQPKCSGRTQLCKEVLNDTWVSFPTWSEDSTFVTSRKTQFEEFIYRCEDERFELDGVIETNAATIRVLEGVHKKMGRMSQEELQRFKLDDCLGGCSPTIHQRALRRIYGEKATDIMDGLKKNPMVAVPVVLRRLKTKEEEWREAQKGFNKIWREQNEKYYLKSLDHQGINFKQNDLKALRSKSLFNEIEILYDERHEQVDDSGDNTSSSGPHLILPYKDKSVLDDAANLLIHHVKRQTAIHKEDKQKIKQLLKHFIPDLFFHPRQDLSDDEQDEENDKDDASVVSNGGINPPSSNSLPLNPSTQNNSQSKNSDSPVPSVTVKTEPDIKVPLHALSTDPDECYSLFMASNNWYLFLRLHQILCERLIKMYEKANILAEEESRFKQQRKESTAVALRLKPKNDIEVEEYYPAFLDMVKNVLDGNMEGHAYEDTLREMFGIHAYIAFTLDKVVTYAVRQLQHLVSDSICQQCTELFQKEHKQSKENCGAGGACSTAYVRVAAEAAYQRKAEKVMSEENCFKIYIYKKDCKMTIELLDTESDDNADSNSNSRGERERERETVVATEKWSTYVERFSTPPTTTTSSTAATPGLAQASEESSSKDLPPTNSDSEPSCSSNNHPVSSDQAAKGGRGRKRKNTDINKKIDATNWSSLEKVLAGRKRVYLYRNVRRYRKHAARRMRNFSPEPSKLDKPLDEKKEFQEVSDVPENSDLVTSDEMQCTFNVNKYRVVYVVNQETMLYNKGSFTRAKQSHPVVTRTMHTNFQKWQSKWISKNLVDSQHRTCQDWLMGRCENLIPHKTCTVSNNDLNVTPYRQYNRYRVEHLQADRNNEQPRSSE